MTFSLRSNSRFGGKRSLLVTADKATLYQCSNGQIDVAYEFSADESGRENFLRYLTQTDRDPIYILIDIVEEEYRQDVIPHVFGADRKSVLERKFARLFRGTTYCHALTQGRETEGRRDDKVLLTAITKPDIVLPWLELIRDQKIPLAGIFSLPVLSQQLLKKIGAKGSNVLLVSVQRSSGLRQTFFRDRQIKISRLAQMPRIGSVPYAAHIMGELEKLRRYLNSLGLISRDGPLEVYILSHGDWLNELEQRCRDTEEERFFLLDVADIASRLGLPKKLASAYSDVIFNQLLLDIAPKNHYASEEETKYFSLHRLRNGLMAASVLLLVGSLGWSGFNFLDGVSLKQQALDAEQKANFYQARYSIARQDLPPTPVEPRDIKTAVDVVETLRRYKGDPTPILEVISDVLDASPGVRLDQAEWFSAVDPNSSGKRDSRQRKVVEGRLIERDGKYSHYHIAVLKGHLRSFSGDYRAAIAQADDLVAGLAAQADVKWAEVLEYPLDVAPDTNLSGSASDAAATPEARFALKVVLGIRVAETDDEVLGSSARSVRTASRVAAAGDFGGERGLQNGTRRMNSRVR